MDNSDSDSDLSHTTWQDIVEGLKNNTLIKVEHRDDAPGRPNNSPILYLDSQSFPIDSEGAKAIAAALETNISCEHCEFYSNLFEKEGAEAIASALLKNTTLKFLSLNTNNIENEGIEAITNALLINKTLTSLDLSNNGVFNEDNDVSVVKSIVNMMNVNTSLTNFKFNSNGLTESGIVSIIKVLSSLNHSLTSVDLSFNRIPNREDDEISDKLKEAVSELIQNNFSLTHFELFSLGNNIRYFSPAQKFQYDINKSMIERNRMIQKEALMATSKYMRVWGSQMSNLTYDQFESEGMRFYRNIILQIASKYM